MLCQDLSPDTFLSVRSRAPDATINLTSLQNGTFGRIHRKAPVMFLTQEHGIIEVDDKLLDEIEILDLLLVFPIHSCLTCNLYKGYKTLDGEVISRL